MRTIVFERFFDATGGMQLVIHSPYGSRLNRAWGLALRKRFCRKFNFELQAAATEDNIVLSLTTAHSFELAEAARYLHSATVRPLLTEALLDAPMFTTRWRWVAGVALALPRFRGGKKVPRAPRPHGGRGSHRRDLSRSGRLRREPRRGARDPGSSADPPDDRRLPRRGDGRRRSGTAPGAARGGRDQGRRARSRRAVAARPRSAGGPALRLSRRCAAGRAPHPGGDRAALAGAGGGRRIGPPRPRGDRAGCGARPGPSRRTPTNCTTPSSGSAF